METDIALRHRDERGPDSLQRILVLIGLGYAALVCLAFYADYKIQLRRARKRREARQYSAKDLEWFKKGEDDPSPRS